MPEKWYHLRCALVWERTLLQEKIFTPGSRVSVGESTGATFTLHAPGLGRRHTVLRPNRSGAVLSLKNGMLGRIGIQGRTYEVEDLLDDPAGLAERRGDAIEHKLSFEDGGVLVFGRVGLAFDFVEDPGRVPPARLGQVLGSDKNVNKLFGGGMGVLMVLALVSRLFAAPPAAFTVEQLPDRFVSFITDDPESAKAFRKEMERRREEKKVRARKKKERAETRPDRKSPARPAAGKSAEDRETRKIRKKVSSRGVVGAISKARRKKGALADVLDDGGLGIDLDDALRALDRGARARVITSTGTSGPLLPSLVRRRGTPDVEEGPRTGRTGRRAARGSRLAERREATVALSMPSAAAKVTGGRLSKQQIAKVVQGNKGAIRYCYESQLTRYPTLRGKIVVDFIIEPSGSVKTVKIPTNDLSNKTAAGKVASCLIRFIKRWRFPKPKGGKVRVIYPFTFGRRR